MTISEESYEDLKEFWDQQRLIQYNRELIQKHVSRLYKEAVFIDYSEEELFKYFWQKLDESKFDRPPRTWVPKDSNLRKWNE